MKPEGVLNCIAVETAQGVSDVVSTVLIGPGVDQPVPAFDSEFETKIRCVVESVEVEESEIRVRQRKEREERTNPEQVSFLHSVSM